MDGLSGCRHLYRMEKKKNKVILLGIILLALLLRIVFLQSVPSGISDDELEFILNAKAIFYTGRDVTGTWSPLTNGLRANIFPIAPYIFNIPVAGPLPFNPLVNKLPYIGFHILLILTLYFITKRLVNKHAALLVAFTAAINPWMIFFGRTAFESPVSILFYLFGFYLLLQKNTWFSVLAFFCYVIAFFTYTGAKVIFIPFVLLTLLFAWFNNTRSETIWRYAAIALLSLVLFTGQLMTLRTQAIGERISEIITPNSSHIVDSVNSERKLTAVFPFTNIFSNKVTVYARYIIGKYFEVYSPTLLFQTGETRATYSLFNHGYFYYLDIVFLFLGLCYLYRVHKKLFLFIVGCLVIGPLPAVINTVESGFAALRAALIFPVFCLIIGVGLYSIAAHKKIALFVYICYALFLGRFLFVYFFQYPIYASDAYGFSKKVLSSYIERSLRIASPVTVYSNAPNAVFKQYLFSSNAYSKDNADSVALLMRRPTYSFGSIHFASCLEPGPKLPNHTYIMETGLCEKHIPPAVLQHVSISLLADGGEVYKIYNDALCSGYQLQRYPRHITLRDLRIDILSNQDFCQQLISSIQ